VEHGETVQILKRGRPFAQLTPTPADLLQSTKPDIMGQLREVWGDRMFSMEEVESMRELELNQGQA
jgi:antitoxin (DNA-binding transcriptional repressor) of toxin-antitoxin stability system